MARPSIIIGPELKILRQNVFPLIGGDQSVQGLGYLTRKVYRMFWATEGEVETQVSAVQGTGWVLEGDPSMSPISPPLDLYDAEMTFIKYTPT